MRLTALTMIVGLLTAFPGIAGLETLSQISSDKKPSIKLQVIEATTSMHQKDNRSTTPVTCRFFDKVDMWDSGTSFSQIYLDDDDKVIGFLLATYDFKDKTQKTVEIRKFGVLEDHRRLGIGKKMVYQMAVRAKELGVTHVNVVVYDENFIAQAAYKKYGFIEDTTISQLYPHSLASLFVAPTEKLIENTAAQ